MTNLVRRSKNDRSCQKKEIEVVKKMKQEWFNRVTNLVLMCLMKYGRVQEVVHCLKLLQPGILNVF